MESYKMTDKIYKVQTPDGIKDVPGPANATDSELIAEAKRLYSPSAKPEPVLTDRQSYMQNMLTAVPPSQQFGAALMTGLGGETIKNVGALTELVSPKYGEPITKYGQSMTDVSEQMNPYSSFAGQIGSYLLPTSMVSKLASKIAPAAKSLLPNMLRSGGVGGTVALGTTPGSVEERLPEVGINTAVGTALPVAGKALEKVGEKILPKIAESPTAEFLSNRATELFTKAKDSGVVLNTKDFTSTMKNIGKDLRNEGYDAELYPKVAKALKNLQDAKTPKDFTELQVLRKFIQNAQAGAGDNVERKIATMLKNEFDNYVANIPESSIKSGSKEGLAVWKEARDTYSKMSKAEVFEDMLKRAEFDKTKFTQSGEENSLTMQLRNLAKNPKQMRLFTADEQKAIEEAAKGGNIQNTLRFIGKYAPTSVISTGIGGGTGAAIGSMIGGPTGAAIGGAAVPIIGGLAREGATAMRKNQLETLAELMRSGGKGTDLQSRVNLTPEQKNLVRLLNQGMTLQQTTQGE
jgi:hypothetical protein